MCYTKSGIAVYKDTLQIFTLPGEDSHSKIAEHFNIRDDYAQLNSVAKFEFRPTTDLMDLSSYILICDEDRKPDWWNNQESKIRSKITAIWASELNNKVFKGSLNLMNTQIKKLPDNLTVGGYFNLEGTQIKELPDNLTVGGNLNLGRTQIKELPANLKVGGSLYLQGTQIKELPANLKVGSSLDLGDTQIKELPANLIVGGQIYR